MHLTERPWSISTIARRVTAGPTTLGGRCQMTTAAGFGVTCSDGRVIQLSLHRNNLSGTIPAELGGLSALRSLDLSFNDLSGTIPAELGGLSAFRSLDLSFNDLSGTIPGRAREPGLPHDPWPQL